MKVCRYLAYRDIVSAAKNTEVFSNRQGLTNLRQRSGLFGQLKLRHIPLLLRHATLIGREAWSNARRRHGRFAELQPAEANRYRRPIRLFLRKRGSAGMVPIIERHIDRARRRRSVCLCRDVVWPCTEHATREMLGIPENQWAGYREPMLRFMIGAEPDPVLSLLTRIRARHRLEREVARQRTAPVVDGLISRLIEWRDEAGRFTDTEIAGSIWMILGGYIGTEYFLASALHYFADHGLARQEFLNNPGLRGAAIEELLRYFTPGTTSQRLITADCVAGGEQYGRGDVAILDWAAGNFDATVFAQPDEVNFHRPPREHLTFGAGAHYCLGAGFAREFSELFLVRFLEAFPHYRIDASKSVRQQHASLAGFETLPADLGHVPIIEAAAAAVAAR
jgi:cytochrome P450